MSQSRLVTKLIKQ